MGLNPLVQRVITPSTSSFYLAGESAHYPTAWLDLDGNERASVQLRNSDINKIHILLLQLARPNLPSNARRAAAMCVSETISRHRAEWTKTVSELGEEMRAVQETINERKKIDQPKSRTDEQEDDMVARRASDQLQALEHEHTEYTAFLAHLHALLDLQIDMERPFRQKISEFIPDLTLSDNNRVYDLQNYICGPSVGGLVVSADGRLDEKRSFRFVNYFSLLAQQRARNNPQAALSSRPIDFEAMSLGAPNFAYWLYADEQNQVLIQVNRAGQISLKPIRHLTQDESGKITWIPQDWRAGLPLHIFEDPQLRVPPGSDRKSWLSDWHSESEWLKAIHMCQYSNGVISVVEYLSPVGENVPGPAGMNPILLRFERRRRELVQADFHIFAADHWNFNARNFNPGGNHGSFFRISTHSVWMMAGSGVPVSRIEEPYDSLNFASTVLSLMGRTPPIPERVVLLQ